MLDDLKLIHQRDAHDALGVAAKEWQQLQTEYQLGAIDMSAIQNIVWAGMGGSALAALLSQTWPGYDIPFEICRGYDIPRYTGPGTLFVASSYSGNTEETLSALDAAQERGARIVVAAAGGRLGEIAASRNYPWLRLPDVGQPRFAVFASYKALLTLLERAGQMPSATLQTLASASRFLETAAGTWAVDVPTRNNLAKQIALECMGKSAVIYAGPLMYPAAYKWKISFNESAKNVAWCNQYPEFNHNEFMGWTSHPVDKPYAVIDLRSSFEHPQIQKRFEVSERLLSGRRPAPIVVEAAGGDVLQQLLWTVTLGDFVSLYLAVLNGVDPTPVKLIEDLKRALAE